MDILLLEKSLKYRECTKEECIFWFDVLNYHYFNSKLVQFDSIDIKRVRGAYGTCSYDIKDNKRVWFLEMDKTRLRNKFDLFIGTLAHEMVHLYQSQFLMQDMSENDITFKEFEEKFSYSGIYIDEIKDEKN